MEPELDLKSIPDAELLRRLGELLRQSRRVEADLVAHIGEVDRRRLYAHEAVPSMFAYCTELLHLSEAEAYLRIAAARASREHPMLLEMLGDGRLHLTGIAKLAPHLTPDNREGLLKSAAYRSKRQIEELVAELVPRPDAPAAMRRLPAGRAHAEPPLGRRPDAVAPSFARIDPAGVAPSASRLAAGAAGEPAIELRPDRVGGATRPASVEPLALARYKVQFTASAELHDKLERLRALMRSSVPDGDLAAIIERAVSEMLERLEARRFAKTKRPRNGPSTPEAGSRYIPAAVRRAVYERDGGRCRFVDAQGRRCMARDRLEFHHRHPFGHGGDGGLANVQLLCKSHNLFVAEADYGSQAIARRRRPPDRVSEASAVYSVAGLTPRDT